MNALQHWVLVLICIHRRDMHSYVLMFLFICCISGPLLCLPLDVFPVQTFPMENEMITFARNLGVEADIMAICME